MKQTMKTKHLRRIFKLFIYSLCILFLKTFNVNAQTDIEAGDVSGTWSSQNSPYRIFGEISVPDQETLTIEPGVNINFQGHYKFIINGRLLAIGNQNDTIVFNIQDTTGFSDTSSIDGGWHGFRFTDISASNDSSILEYCKISYGKAIGDSIKDLHGGAIYLNNSSKLRISNSLIENCLSKKFGGGIYCEHSSPVINNNIIKNNIAFCRYDTADGLSYKGGGAICCVDSASPLIKENSICYNFASSHGGAIKCYYLSSPEIRNNIFDYNKATSGGAISLGFHSNPIMTQNTFSNNYAELIGGAIEIRSFIDCEVTNNIFENNYAEHNGGALYISSGAGPLIVNNLISNNSAFMEGGGIRFTGSSPNYTIIANNIICNNDAYRGGAMHLAFSFGNANTLLSNNLVAYNTAAVGAGIYNDEFSSLTINTIVWGNVSSQDSLQIFNNECNANYNYCAIEDSIEGEGNINIDPLFISPPLGAGPIYNGLIADWNVSLNSNCINAGIADTTDLNIPLFDFLGNPRVFQERIDIGPYECQEIVGIDCFNSESGIFKIKLYPNPTNNIVNIEIDKIENTSYRFRIINIYGKEIYHKDLYITDNKTSFSVDLTQQSKGVYFAEIQNDNKRITAKFILN